MPRSSIAWRLLSAGLFVVIVQSTHAYAATYYLSPSGSDSNSGSSTSSPWKTFGFAIPRLKVGDTLILRDGTYNRSNSGHVYLNCGSNAASGSSSASITVKAENERRALIKGDGTNNTITILNCSWWRFEGLRIESTDTLSGTGGYPVQIQNSPNLVFVRNIIRLNNRYRTRGLINVEPGGTDNHLLEENEFYDFNGHAVVYRGTGHVFRRNYCNSRRRTDIAGGIASAFPTHGENCFSLYPVSNGIVENNISEGNNGLFELNGGGVNNKFYGNIALDSAQGALPNARGSTLSKMPQDTYIEHYVNINQYHSGLYGLKAGSAKSTRCVNCSFIGASGGGVHAFEQSVNIGDGNPSMFLTNNLFLNLTGASWYIVNQTGFSVDYARVFNSGSPTPGLTHSSVTNVSKTDPGMQSCRVFVPDSSNLKGAGKGGADIGASVLYRYDKGSLTNQPLWDPTTGAFPHGAIIPGVNDVAGSSAFDVHKRLNVNANGCSLPAGYGKTAGTSTGGTSTPTVSSGSLAHSGTMIANSGNFASDHPVNHLWDGCLDGAPVCTSGNGSISSFWIEFDMGQLYSLTQARLFGDADHKWVSTSWKLSYKTKLGDPWTTAFSNVNAFFNNWSTQNLSATARYVRVEVFGNQSVPATQARELEIYGTPGTVPGRPKPPGNLAVVQ